MSCGRWRQCNWGTVKNCDLVHLLGTHARHACVNRSTCSRQQSAQGRREWEQQRGTVYAGSVAATAPTPNGRPKVIGSMTVL